MSNTRKRLDRIEKLLASLRKSRGEVPQGDVFPPGWEPKSSAQKAALECLADILLFGGAAGSLKTETLLVDAARESSNPNLRAIVFRRKLTQLSDIIDKTQRLYRPLGGVWSSSDSTWRFPSGASIRLAYLNTNEDIYEYLGPRYSFIGFDESTAFSEYQVRNMLGRLSSTDRRLRLRMRLASNPGGVGAAWQKSMFLRGGCPVHTPRICAETGKVYRDACWPGDRYPLVDVNDQGLSVAFIPGRLSDHNLLDEGYVYRLRGMSGSLSAAMEQGCWCALEGAYFSNWDAKKMVIPYGDINEKWWDSHFISLDYGFGHSSASAHLHVRTQDGRVRTIGEVVAGNLPAYQFAQEVVDRLVRPEIGGNRRRIVAVFLDPSNFRHNGTGHSVAEQVNEVLECYELGAVEACNDRVGGWQRLYQMLQRGEWQIADTCPLLIEAIPTRIHDMKRPGDVLKVPGDPLDDVADDARYGLNTFVTVSFEPWELKARAECRALAEQGDLTSAAIRWLQRKAEAEYVEPVRIGRYRPRGPWRR